MTPDGMPTGIMVDIFQTAAGRARLRYKFLKPADRSEYKPCWRTAGGFCH